MLEASKTKLLNFSNSVAACSFPIIALTETWLDSSVFDNELFDETYNIFREDRNFTAVKKSRGGGVLIAIDSNIHAEKLNLRFGDFLTIQNIDIVATKLTINRQSCYIFVVYIPPEANSNAYETLFESISSLDYVLNSNVLILGDFNLRLYSLHVSNSVKCRKSNNIY